MAVDVTLSGLASDVSRTTSESSVTSEAEIEARRKRFSDQPRRHSKSEPNLPTFTEDTVPVPRSGRLDLRSRWRNSTANFEDIRQKFAETSQVSGGIVSKVSGTIRRSSITRSETMEMRKAIRREVKQAIDLSLWTTLVLVLSGEFAFDNWMVEDEGHAMRASIIAMMTNFSIVAGLTLSIILPPLTEVDVFMPQEISDVPGFRSCSPETCVKANDYLPVLIMANFVASSTCCIGSVMVSNATSPRLPACSAGMDCTEGKGPHHAKRFTDRSVCGLWQLALQNMVTLQFVHSDGVARFALLAKHKLLLPVRLFVPTLVFAILGHYLRLVMIFGWLGTTIVFWSIVLSGMGYFVYAMCVTTKALYESNVTVPGAVTKWGALARKHVRCLDGGTSPIEGDTPPLTPCETPPETQPPSLRREEGSRAPEELQDDAGCGSSSGSLRIETQRFSGRELRVHAAASPPARSAPC